MSKKDKQLYSQDNVIKYIIAADVACNYTYYGLKERTLVTIFKVENNVTYVVENRFEPKDLLIPERKGWFERLVKEFSEKYNDCAIEVIKDID